MEFGELTAGNHEFEHTHADMFKKLTLFCLCACQPIFTKITTFHRSYVISWMKVHLHVRWKSSFKYSFKLLLHEISFQVDPPRNFKTIQKKSFKVLIDQQSQNLQTTPICISILILCFHSRFIAIRFIMCLSLQTDCVAWNYTCLI